MTTLRPWPTISTLILTLLQALTGVSMASDATHSGIAVSLGDQAHIEESRSRLAAKWQIVGMNSLPLLVQGNLVGRGLVAAANDCGLTLEWDNDSSPEKLIWPVILKEATPEEIHEYLARPWVSANQPPPTYLENAAVELAKRVQRWGIGFTSIKIEGSAKKPQELDFTFIDGTRVSLANDLAVFDYSVIATIAGVSMPEGTPVDPDYSYLSLWQQELQALAGTNEERLSKVCRALGVVKVAICPGAARGVSTNAVEQALASVDAQCAPNGEMVERLHLIEQRLTTAMQAK